MLVVKKRMQLRPQVWSGQWNEKKILWTFATHLLFFIGWFLYIYFWNELSSSSQSSTWLWNANHQDFPCHSQSCFHSGRYGSYRSRCICYCGWKPRRWSVFQPSAHCHRYHHHWMCDVYDFLFWLLWCCQGVPRSFESLRVYRFPFDCWRSCSHSLYHDAQVQRFERSWKCVEGSGTRHQRDDWERFEMLWMDWTKPVSVWSVRRSESAIHSRMWNQTAWFVCTRIPHSDDCRILRGRSAGNGNVFRHFVVGGSVAACSYG